MSRVRVSVAVLALLVVGVAAAGCVQEPAPAGTVAPAGGGRAASLPLDWVTRVVPGGEAHDHNDPAQHQNLSTPNFHVIGWDPLVTDHYGTSVVGMGCGGVGTTGEGRRIAIVHSIATDVAFVVADVTDPAKPVKLGEYVLPNVVVWDATVTPDGMHVLVGAYPFVFGGDVATPAGPVPVPPAAAAASAPVAIQPMWRDACTGETRAAGPEQYVIMGPSLIMVGLQDPSSPQLEQWIPQPVVGPHSVYATEIDGVTYAASSVTNLQHEASYYHFFEVQEGPAGGVLVPLSVIQAPGIRPPLDLNGHIDVAMHKHPVTGQVLAYLANWGTGVEVYDMSDPRMPVHMTTWADGDEGSLHNTWPLPEMWGDKHYTIVGQEVGAPEDRPSGWVYVLDTTDPANPVEVSRWTLPVQPDWAGGGLQFSTHYVDVLNRTMFVTNYHGGMWAVDLTDPATPKTIGIFVPANVSPQPYGGAAGGPGVEDVVVDHALGLLTVWDGGGGIYQLHFDASDPAPAITEWPVAGE